MKLMVMPFVMWVAAQIFDLGPLATVVLVAAGATPGTAASYVLARELGWQRGIHSRTYYRHDAIVSFRSTDCPIDCRIGSYSIECRCVLDQFSDKVRNRFSGN